MSVSPARVRAIAPLCTTSVSGSGSGATAGSAKKKLRPVTMAMWMPRAGASVMAARFSSGNWPRLSSSVPSTSMPISWIFDVCPVAGGIESYSRR